MKFVIEVPDNDQETVDWVRSVLEGGSVLGEFDTLVFTENWEATT